MKYFIVVMMNLASLPVLAEKYIITSKDGKPHIMLAEGFVPQNSQIAPSGDFAESDLDKVDGKWVVNTARKSARVVAESAEDTRKTSVRNARSAKFKELLAKIKAGDKLTNQEVEDAVVVLLRDKFPDSD